MQNNIGDQPSYVGGFQAVVAVGNVIGNQNNVGNNQGRIQIPANLPQVPAVDVPAMIEAAAKLRLAQQKPVPQQPIQPQPVQQQVKQQVQQRPNNNAPQLAPQVQPAAPNYFQQRVAVHRPPPPPNKLPPTAPPQQYLGKYLPQFADKMDQQNQRKPMDNMGYEQRENNFVNDEMDYGWNDNGMNYDSGMSGSGGGMQGKKKNEMQNLSGGVGRVSINDYNFNDNNNGNAINGDVEMHMGGDADCPGSYMYQFRDDDDDKDKNKNKKQKKNKKKNKF